MQPFVFFDLDGTLTNPQRGISACIAHALREMGLPMPTQTSLNEWIGPPLFDSFADHLGSTSLAKDALALYRERFSTVGLFENEVYPGTLDMLQKAGSVSSAMFVVTSKPRTFAERIVRHFGMAPFFRFVYGSELDGTLADKSELLAHVLHRESIDPSSAIMIGDRRHDIAGARRNAIRSVGVLWGFGSRAELETAGADTVCDSIEDLLRHIKGSDRGK